MTVPAKVFLRWLDGVAGGASHAAVCRAAGIKRSTLGQQLVRGRVTLATVAAVSRSLRLPVVESLSTFAPYQGLAAGVAQPTDAELLSQVSDMDLLREILYRSARAENGSAPPPAGLSPIPHRASVRAWLDAVDPSELRQSVARDAGIAPQNLSAQITANRLTPELAIRSAELAGVGLANGLVATGFLTAAEAGWRPGSRSAALRRTPSSMLVSLTAERLDALGRTLRRTEQDSAAAQTIWENLA
ncbi:MULTISPECIES: hypothetical protein [unclassified Arthrobacter]|uniref:hypothetical protein n=1 Tax=unclassified Arthrobacter TaxID=235627 RepID=UPI00159DE7F9|nr:hypothetical protein [Arthrobacter sp. STN4]MCQ9162912.1 hypothetical protein [Arthrobacter sp. STN4]NVM97447.1 hypothetical protein [Arthrobacter sp. SDTb3-6]